MKFDGVIASVAALGVPGGPFLVVSIISMPSEIQYIMSDNRWMGRLARAGYSWYQSGFKIMSAGGNHGSAGCALGVLV